MDRAAIIERRLAEIRASRGTGTIRRTGTQPAERLATALGGEVIRTGRGSIVRCETRGRRLPLDRLRLATLPGQPPADVPLICLDTETTGLATASGTVAFLVGLGWWNSDTFHQVQLLLPDHADESALLDAITQLIPPEGWLVTYNGRGFDWPLLVARYRLARRTPPPLAGHLDLLPIVRRLFRHRMTDARLRTAEATLLDLRRLDDVDGREIPGRYLEFLRGGPAATLVDVVRHNDEDVRSLARLLAHLERGYGDSVARSGAPRGDLAGLARAFSREGRLADALECLETAASRTEADDPPEVRRIVSSHTTGSDDEAWWSPRHRPDFGGSHRRAEASARDSRQGRVETPWTDERVTLERARLLRRLRRFDEAVEAWAGLAAGTGRLALVATVEIAKIREHRLGDLEGALEATHRGLLIASRRRRLGRPEVALESDLLRRLERLRLRLTRRGRAA
jgi:uncharacterized protein